MPALTITADEADRLLRPYFKTCDICMRCSGSIHHAMNDIGDARAKVRRARHPEEFVTRLQDAKNALREAIDIAISHLDEPHMEPAEKVAREVRPKKVDDRISCPTCGTKVRVHDGNSIRKHGNCRRRYVNPPTLTELPPVVIPDKATGNPARGTTLPVTGLCHTCDRPISGERRYCGPCAAVRR